MFKFGKIFGGWERKDPTKNGMDGKNGGKGTDLTASLRQVVAESGLDGASLQIAFPVKDGEKPRIEDRRVIFITDKAQRFGEWLIDSLAGLFRGDREPPEDMDHYPEEYVTDFYLIESAVLLVHEFTHEVTDEEYIRTYSLVRRRPEGRSEGLLHDAVYQAAAFFLGTTPRSAKEFEAVLLQLERSARHWKMGSSSRNYIGHLKTSFSDAMEKKDSGFQNLLKRSRARNSPLKDAAIVENPPGLRKASEMILDFADPFMEAINDPGFPDLNDNVHKNAIAFAIMAWNTAMVPVGEEASTKKKAISAFLIAGDGKEFEDFLSAWFDRLVERKKKKFANDKRFMVDYEWTGSGNTLRLNVMSAFPGK